MSRVPKVAYVVGDARDSLQAVPADSVHCVWTSPPYYGLREYDIPPAVWGGDPLCVHTWVKGNQPPTKLGMNLAEPAAGQLRSGCWCTGCGAWYGLLGLEPTVDLYVAHLVEVCEGVRRVLRPDGIFWLNLGDSFYGDAPGQRTRRSETDAAADGLRRKSLIGVPWRVAFALQRAGWYLRMDVVWCLSGGTQVYARTPRTEGPMMVRELAKLKPATVQLWNGERWTQMLGMSETFPEESLELELRSGERICSTPEHQWPTTRGLLRTDEIRVGDVLQSCRLPEPALPDAPDCLPDDDVGWFVGLYIAEGSRSKTSIQIAGHVAEDERFERLKEIAARFHGTCRRHRTGGNSATVNLTGSVLHGILDAYVSGRTAHTKHLDSRCWRRSNAFLEAVLDGYLSGDGGWDARNSRYRLGCCGNEALAVTLRTLCARLGFGLRLKPCFARAHGKRFVSFRGELRKLRSGHANQKDDAEVVAIRRGHGRRFYEIGVADEPHTFALASGVLTHNCKPNAIPDSATDRPTKAHEYVFMLTKEPRYWYDRDAVAEPVAAATQARARRGLGNRSGGHKMLRGAPGQRPHSMHVVRANDQTRVVPVTRNRRSVWSIPTASFKKEHFATAPPALIRPSIRASCSEFGCCPECRAQFERVVVVHREDPKRLSEREWLEYAAKKGLPLNDRKARLRAGLDLRKKGMASTNTIYAGVGRTRPGDGPGFVELPVRDDAGRTHSTAEQRMGKSPPPERGWQSVRETIGWRPTCACYDWRYRMEMPRPRGRKWDQRLATGDWWKRVRARPAPAAWFHEVPLGRPLVLDPFAGAGTVGLEANRHGAHALLLDVGEKYAKLGLQRIMDDIEARTNPRPPRRSRAPAAPAASPDQLALF